MISFFRRTRLANDPAERRRLRRDPVVAAASIRFADRILPCTTMDLSNGGAKLHLSKAVILPGQFRVEVPSRKLARHARLVWRKDDHLGVEFVAAGG